MTEQQKCSRCGEPADASPNRCKLCKKYNDYYNQIVVLFRKSVLDAHPDYPKKGTDALTKLMGVDFKEYDKLFQTARTKYFANLLGEKTEGETEEDIRLRREGILLQLRNDITRDYEGGTRIIRHRHNNEQVAISTVLNGKGIPCITEKNYGDLVMESLDALGEIKVEPDKQDYATAIGELAFGELAFEKPMKKFIISVERTTPKSVLKQLTALSTSAFSKVGDKIVADFVAPGHEQIAAALGAVWGASGR